MDHKITTATPNKIQIGEEAPGEGDRARGGNGNPNSNKERPECKICHKVAHTAFLLAVFARIDRGELRFHLAASGAPTILFH
jgi:hypothetical protein